MASNNLRIAPASQVTFGDLGLLVLVLI